MKKKKSTFSVWRAIITIAIISSIMIVYGCGGGSSSSDGGSSPTILSGNFIDSPVEGIEYQTATQNGTTDAQGTFTYQSGEIISFYVGGVFLGSTLGKSVITPIDLVDGATDVYDQVVTNIAQFIQSLDEDENVFNGITISEATISEILASNIDDITDPNLDINNNIAIQNLFSALGIIPVSAAEAQQNLLDFIGGGTGGDVDGDNVTNDFDQCPGTPAGATVDVNGCADSQKDTDNDGFTDDIDQCPGTPAGESVDTNGCSACQNDPTGAGCPSSDDDDDGVTNETDQCPGTPAGESVDTNGCSACQNDPTGTGCPGGDDDDDGVTNDADQCPGTPAGATVDVNGCADSQKDTDDDGFADDIDQCPGTPAGENVDTNGCSACQNDSTGTGCPDGDDDDDGVKNDADPCPGTPVGENVDTNGCSACQNDPTGIGCPGDDDCDCVTNDADQCPGTPVGESVDANGCYLCQNDPTASGCAGGDGILHLIWWDSYRNTIRRPTGGDWAEWTVRRGNSSGPVIVTGNGPDSDGTDDVFVPVSPTSYTVIIYWYYEQDDVAGQTVIDDIYIATPGQVIRLNYQPTTENHIIDSKQRT